MHWARAKLARLVQPLVQQAQDDLKQARADLSRQRDDLDEMANIIESKDRQIRAAAEALAKANADAANSRRLANQLQSSLDNERRFIKQMNSQLSVARKNSKRR